MVIYRHIKKKIIEKYGKTKVMPNSLALDQIEADLLMINS